jgi:hypothetical protein
VIRTAALLFHLPFTRHEPAAGAAAATGAVDMAERVARSLEGWHEFYLMAGTAAVTLVGLLFVALSFHLDAMLHEHRAHLLAAARLAFMNFVYVLMLSLFFLIPDNTPALLGIAGTILSTATLGYVLVAGFRSRPRGKPTEHEQFLRRRYAISGFVTGLAIVSSVSLVIEPRPVLLYNFVAVVCAMLANAAGMSWDLLVQVGRVRRAAGETPRA